MNGKEIVRGHLKPGPVRVDAAEPYPAEAFVTAEGEVIDRRSGGGDTGRRVGLRMRELAGVVSPEHRAVLSAAMTGRVWMYYDQETIRVLPDDVVLYEAVGWARGRGPPQASGVGGMRGRVWVFRGPDDPSKPR